MIPELYFMKPLLNIIYILFKIIASEQLITYIHFCIISLYDCLITNPRRKYIVLLYEW